jgi:putative FmdB family regulatory protein
MPIYEYQCGACSAVSEILQKVSDAPATVCPKCGESALKKKLSAPAFRLKGSGWYETDFKTGAKKNLAGDGSDAGGEKKAGDKDAKSGDATKSSSAGGSDSKPAKGGGSASAA